ncbi:MAG: oligosaccharide flippase family protein [Gemmatimonadetes bacterium]|nr:oligosaccharide flippase family protein [Gemmatimonadota bacterium]MYK53829.1 oligosaccharide flippase family protein [Gemmatimonadota bacterium]
MKKPTTPTEASAIQRIAHGAIQTFGSTYPARLINFAVLLLLYQILVPEDFGAITTAYSILALVIAIRDFGLHYALLHEHDNVHEFAPTHFVLSISLGSISTLLALCIALYSEHLFELFNTYLGFTDTQNYPKVAIALGILGAFDLLRTAALTAETQLQRNLEFGRLAFAHAGGTILAALVGLGLAYLGYGKWALILGFFPYSVTYILFYCTVVWLRHPPPLNQLHTFNAQAARRMIRYGVWFWIGGIPKIFIQHYDKLIISLFFGLSLRGIYDAAHNFAQIPSGAITMVIVRITATVYARYQNNRDQLSAAYRRTSRLILRTTVPISLVLALEANRWIHIFKPDWAPAAPLLQWLIIYSLCRPILDDVHALFYSAGSPKSIAKFSAAQALILLILAPYLAHHMGAVGIAISMNAIAIVGLILALILVRAYVDIPIAKTFAPPLIAAAIGTGMHFASTEWLNTLPIPIGVLAGSAIFTTGYGSGLLIVERKTLIDEIKTVIRAIIKK